MASIAEINATNAATAKAAADKIAASKENLGKTKDTDNPARAQTGTVNSLNQNFDTFVRLLTTQLKNQDPTAPTDNTEFTNQLALFSSVEQAQKSNDNLSKLQDQISNLSTTLTGSSADSLSALNSLVNINKAVNPSIYYVGRMVDVKGNQTEIAGGGAPITFALDKDADKVTIAIKDADGRIVQSVDMGAATKGRTAVYWDGTDNTGTKRTSGVYSFSVIATSTGTPVAATPYTSGLVDGADFSGDAAKLSIGKLNVNMSDVVAVRDIPTAASGTGS
jgi:flagellar basal-body rod modification protein FlgD